MTPRRSGKSDAFPPACALRDMQAACTRTSLTRDRLHSDQGVELLRGAAVLSKSKSKSNADVLASEQAKGSALGYEVDASMARQALRR